MNYTLKDAYILCGGRSSRFGSDKALAKINNRTIIEIISEELRKVFEKIVLVTDEPDKYPFLQLECITDLYQIRGPLAGIHAALKHAQTEKVFIISCDMPLITEEVIRFIAEYETDKKVTLPKAGEKRHHLCAVYSRELLPAAEQLLEESKNQGKSASPFDLINRAGFELIDFNNLPGFDVKCFFNLNMPEDLSKIKSQK